MSWISTRSINSVVKPEPTYNVTVFLLEEKTVNKLIFDKKMPKLQPLPSIKAIKSKEINVKPIYA